MAAIVGKLASSGIAQKLASSSIGQSIIDKVAPNPDVIEAEMLKRRGPPPLEGPPSPGAGQIEASVILNKKIEEGVEKVIELKDKFDSKLGSYYWTLRIILVIVVVTIISIIIYKYKLPIICYGCESPEGFSKYIFKCVNDSSKDSDLCKISNAIDQGTIGIYNELDKINIISRSVFKQLSTHIPETIKNSLSYIIDKISTLISELIKEITNLSTNFTTFLNNSFSSIKDIYIKTRDDLYTIVLKPIIDFISASIITPISTIITELLAFKDIISNAISSTISKVTGVFTDLKDEIIKPLKNMPKSLEAFINQIIHFLNDFAKGGAKITRDSINTIVDGINDAVNKIIGFLNDFAKGGAKITRESINTVVDKISDAVNTTITGINDTVKGATGVTRTAVHGVIDGVETGVNTTVSGIKTGVNTIVKGINDVTKGATGVTRTAIHGTIDGIELGVNTTVSGTVTGIETGVNTIVKGINDVTKGATGATRTAVHTVVGGIETSINDTVKGINTATSGLSSGLTTSVNPIVGVVNEVVGGVNKVLDIKVPALKLPQIDFPGLNFGTLGSTPKVTVIGETTLLPEWIPFSSVSKAKKVNFDGITIPSIGNVTINKPTIDDPKAISDISIPNKPSIKDSKGNLKYISITKPTIDDPKAIDSIDIPGISITKPTINDPTAIGKVSIPKPDIRDPDVISNISIPKPDIQDPKIIPDVSLDKVSEDINNGLSFAYEKATGGIRKVYNDAMDPINNAITTLVGLATTLSASINIFFEKYLNMEFLTNALKQIQEKVYVTVGEIVNIIKTNVFDPVYNIFLQIKDKIVDFVTDQINYLKGIFMDILTKINKLFETLSDVLWATGSFIMKNIFYVSFYAFTNFVDKIIPLPVQKTVKVNFFLITILYLVFLHYTSVVRAFVKEFLAQYYILFLLLLSFLALYFLFPKREEIIKISSDAQQIASTTVLPAVSNAITASNMTQKETYKNIEMYKNIVPYSTEHQNQFSKVTFK